MTKYNFFSSRRVAKNCRQSRYKANLFLSIRTVVKVPWVVEKVSSFL